MLRLQFNYKRDINMKKLLILAVALCVTAFDAKAFLLNPYIGADYGYSSLNFGKKYDEFYADSFDSYGAVVGLKVFSLLSVEGFYMQSDSEDSQTWGKSKVSTKLKLESYGVDVVGDVLNLGVFEVLSSIGYGYYNADVTNTSTGYNGTVRKKFDEDGNGIRFGLGAQINPTSSIGIRGMFRYTITDMDAVKNMKEFTLGIRYYF